MFCPSKFAPMPSTRLNGVHSSKKRTREKTAFPNVDTHIISKVPKVTYPVYKKRKMELSDATVPKQKNPWGGYEACSGYEALSDLSELFLPIHPDSPMPYETQYELTLEDGQWLDWATPDWLD